MDLPKHSNLKNLYKSCSDPNLMMTLKSVVIQHQKGHSCHIPVCSVILFSIQFHKDHSRFGFCWSNWKISFTFSGSGSPANPLNFLRLVLSKHSWNLSLRLCNLNFSLFKDYNFLLTLLHFKQNDILEHSNCRIGHKTPLKNAHKLEYLIYDRSDTK